MERTSTYPYKPCWNPLSLGMEGGEMIWIICLCLYSIDTSIQAFTLITTHVSKWERGGGFSWCQCLVWQHRGMESESFCLSTMRQDKFRHGRRGNDMNYMLVLVFYRYVYSSLHSYHDPRLKMGARGRLFLVSMLGLTTSRDGVWVVLP